MNGEKPKFIQVGNDRLNIDEIIAYGVESGTRYLIKSADMAEIDESTFIFCYGGYNPDASQINEEDPILDIYGKPVQIQGKIVNPNGISANDFEIKPCRILHIKRKLSILLDNFFSPIFKLKN
ncbi:MAG: hypothetical protein IKN12_10645 [Selenomonadaceae bacterium]|nr:hypothetical protein [Selenomonadaceae bacterium]